MRINSVRIVAFGPFTNSKLEFAPGFTVVHGPNESGKSTWHAATYAALCGMRRRRGRPTDEARFSDRHRPWDANGWLVVGVVTLSDGRTIELRQNLDDKADCTATDLVVGSNVSTEIIGEGSPDASIWLGMDRHVFLATGCIKQSDILSIRESADALQEHLQRAASTAGVDATAAKALELLEEFQRERVGRDMVNSTKPLRRSIERLQGAQIQLQLARREHADFLTRSEATDEQEDQAAALARARRLFEAAVAADRANKAERALDRARELSDRYSDKPVANLSSDDLLAQRAAAAVQGFENQPQPAVLQGPNVDQLAQELAQLPLEPEGDPKPIPEVVNAKTAWDGVAHALSVHDTQRPTQPQDLGISQTADDLRQLAFRLQREQQQPVGAAPRRSTWIGWGLAGAGVLALIGGGLLAIGGYEPAGILTTGAGAVAGAVGVVIALRGRTRGSQARAVPRHGPVAADIQARHLPVDPTELMALGDRIEKEERQRALVSRWLQERDEIADQWRAAAQALQQALEARQVPVRGDLQEALNRYVAECEGRSRQSAMAKRRIDVQKQLEQRQQLEASAESAANQRRAAEAELHAAAAACGLAGGTAGQALDAIRNWLKHREGQIQAATHETGERAELKRILGAGTLDDLNAVTGRLKGDADHLANGISQSEISAVELGPNPERRLRELQGAEREASDAAQRSRGEIEELKARIHDVPAAEEEVAAAEETLGHIRELDQTLTVTRQYLEAAQEQVHRDIAPILANTLNAWLPRITSARYQQAIVDPQTLAVKIRCEAGKWRDAGLVSDGTREQVYLLLRMALAQRLTKKGEISPLLLDEVTVQSDANRTAAILDLLHEMSREVQVILFSQEDEVRSWAEANLAEPQDRLRLLDITAVPA